MPIQIRVVIPDASPGQDVVKPDPAKATSRRGRPFSGHRTTRPCRVKTRPSSAPVTRSNKQLPVKPHDVTMHVASIYDVENEHDYIMVKALQAYDQHCQNEEKDTPKRPSSASPPHPHHNNQRRRLQSSSSEGSPPSPTSSSSSSSTKSGSVSLRERQRRGFKLALCTLKDASGKEPNPVPHSHSSPGPGFLPLQRPWSASPMGRLDAIREVSLANNVQESVKTARPVHQHRLNLRSLPLPSKMDPPVSRSAAYGVRNRTNHSLSDDSGLMLDPMTMSCPSARSLEDHLRSARAYVVPRDPNPSPVVVKGRAIVSPSSPQGRERPMSAAHSFDGGLFLSAGSLNKDYFVIHPDWVSESMTVQKLSLNQRQGRSPGRTVGPASARRGVAGEGGKAGEEEGGGRSRRCKSAPPAKNRNPMTWSS